METAEEREFFAFAEAQFPPETGVDYSLPTRAEQWLERRAQTTQWSRGMLNQHLFESPQTTNRVRRAVFMSVGTLYLAVIAVGSIWQTFFS